MTYAYCPKCGDTMATRSSGRLGTRIQRYRDCKNPDCDYRDVAIVQPEEIISTRILCTQIGHDKQDDDHA